MADGPGVVPDTARRYTKDVADVYADATNALLRAIARRMAANAEAGPLRAKLADVLALRTEAQAVAASVSDALDGALASTIGAAYTHGADQGAIDLADALGYRNAVADRQALHALTATKATTVHGLAKGLGGVLRDLPIARAAADAYQQAVNMAVTPAAAGVETRRQAAQRALDELARRGIGGFTDSAGRRWRLESYAEMATRSVLAQAATQGSVDRIRRTTPFVQVSDQADECERCRKWEGKVLVVGPIPDKWADVDYDGTLADARSGGLFHPNCTHALSAYIPGLTRRRQGRSGARGNKARNEQRRLERGLREWKRRQAVATTDQARTLADRKVAEWSQRIAEHVQATNRHRLRHRETINTPQRRADVPLDELPRIEPDPTPYDLVPSRTVDVEPPEPLTRDTSTAHHEPMPPTATLDDAPPISLTDEQRDDEVARLMGAGDFGPRLEALTRELDTRDAERKADAAKRASLPAAPDPIADRKALDELLPNTRRKRSREEVLRDDYETWAHTQWLRAEDETRGVLLNALGVRDGIDPVDILKRRKGLKYASPEFQEWLAQPGNARMSFEDFRAGAVDDKRARKARERQARRGYESEYG